MRAVKGPMGGGDRRIGESVTGFTKRPRAGVEMRGRATIRGGWANKRRRGEGANGAREAIRWQTTNKRRTAKRALG